MVREKTYARRNASAVGLEHSPSSTRRFAWRRFSLAASLCMAAAMAAGCHKGSSFQTTVTLDPTGTVNLDGGQAQNFTATVAADTTNKGVTWALTLNGAACGASTATTCGTLSNATTTSVTYTAPVVTAVTSVTLTAAAIAKTDITGTATLSIQIPPTITTTSIPTAASNGVPYSATILGANGVAPLTFFVSAGALPAGLTLNSSGTIIGTPTFNGPGSSSTSNFTVQVKDANNVTAATPLALSITVAAPTPLTGSATTPTGIEGAPYSGAIVASGGVPPFSYTLTSGTLSGTGLTLSANGGQITGVPSAAGPIGPLSVQITDSAVPHQVFAVTPVNIAVNAPPALSITTASPLPDGTTGVGYSTTLQATGGTPPYVWSVTNNNGQLPGGLSLATQSNNTGVVSGTPIVQGSSAFTVQVKDSNTVVPQTATVPYTVTIAGGTNAQNNSLFSGGYTFLFKGFDTDGPVSIAGTLTSDGAGNITTGSLDSNRVSGVVGNATIAGGSYSIGISGGDGRGTLHLIISPPSPQAQLLLDFQLVVDSSGAFHMIENNDTATNNDTKSTHGAGVLKPVVQNSGGPTAGDFSGNYAFEFSGQDFASKSMALGGVLHADGTSLLSPIAGDVNDGGTLSALEAPQGNFAFAPPSPRGTASVLYAIGASQNQLHFAFYFVSPSDVVFIETDTPSSAPTAARLSGEAILQKTTVPFGASSLVGTSVLTGSGVSSSNATVMAGLLTTIASGCDGATANATLTYDQNSAGTISSLAPAAKACSVASNGRATFSAPDPRIAVAYLTGPGQGFFLGSDAAVTTGLLEPQTGSAFSTATINGSYALSAPVGDAASNSFVGQLASTGSGSLPGILDEVDAPGKPAHAGTLTITVNGTVASNGRGTAGSNALFGFPGPTIFYIVSPAQIRMIDAANTHPEVIFLSH